MTNEPELINHSIEEWQAEINRMVSDGMLPYVPFGALPAPSDDAAGGRYGDTATEPELLRPLRVLSSRQVPLPCGTGLICCAPARATRSDPPKMRTSDLFIVFLLRHDRPGKASSGVERTQRPETEPTASGLKDSGLGGSIYLSGRRGEISTLLADRVVDITRCRSAIALL